MNDQKTKEEYQKIFFDFLLETPELLNQNYISVDLRPGLEKGKGFAPNDTQAQLDLIKDCPNVFSYIRTGYQMEIRETRYLTILVSEWTSIKRDIKVYQLTNEIV